MCAWGFFGSLFLCLCGCSVCCVLNQNKYEGKLIKISCVSSGECHYTKQSSSIIISINNERFDERHRVSHRETTEERETRQNVLKARF